MLKVIGMDSEGDEIMQVTRNVWENAVAEIATGSFPHRKIVTRGELERATLRALPHNNPNGHDIRHKRIAEAVDDLASEPDGPIRLVDDYVLLTARLPFV